MGSASLVGGTHQLRPLGRTTSLIKLIEAITRGQRKSIIHARIGKHWRYPFLYHKKVQMTNLIKARNWLVAWQRRRDSERHRFACVGWRRCRRRAGMMFRSLARWWWCGFVLPWRGWRFVFGSLHKCCQRPMLPKPWHHRYHIDELLCNILNHLREVLSHAISLSSKRRRKQESWVQFLPPACIVALLDFRSALMLYHHYDWVDQRWYIGCIGSEVLGT